MDRGSRIQLVAILGVTLFVMIAGVAVVAFPRTFGLPGLGTPSASPVATPGAAASPAAALIGP